MKDDIITEKRQFDENRYSNNKSRSYKIRLSMGWKMAVPQPGETPAVYLDQADEAMYEDKRKHKSAINE